MSYSEERFNSFYSRMPLFQKIAEQNGYELKKLLIEKAGVDEVLAAALVTAWMAEQAKKQAPQPASLAGEQFDAYVRDMASFQRLAGLQGVGLADWLQANCGVDGPTAEALIKAAGITPSRKSASLLEVLRAPDRQQPAPAAPEARPAQPGRAPEDDVVITISGAPDEGAGRPAPAAATPGLDAQIDRLHELADNAQHKEPLQLILELKDIRLKKSYLKNPVPHDELEKAERLLRDREERKKKLLRLENKLEQARHAEAELRSNPPKLFRREVHRAKLQEAGEEIGRLEAAVAAAAARETGRQSAYLGAVSCVERHAAAKRDINGRYRADEAKFNAAKQVIIEALHWAQLDIPPEILAGPVMERLGWYESFFKTFPEQMNLPVHGWMKAYAIISKLACDYPLWRGKIDNIHFVVDNEMKGLKDAIRLFLSGFVAQLQEAFAAVCQQEVLRSEAEKTGGQAVVELVAQREKALQESFDDDVLDFCRAELPLFYTVAALAEYLNFEARMVSFFESPDQAVRRPGQAAPDRGAYEKRFAVLAEQSARALEACFTATDEIGALWHNQPFAETITQCRDIIRADFESLFKASREKVHRYESL